MEKKVTLSAALLGWLATAAPLHAAELRWHGPESCDRSAFVIERVENLVGRSLTAVETLDFEISVDPGPDGTWRAKLVTRDTSRANPGERLFEERSCVAVTDAAAVAMAMAIRSAEPEAEPVVAPEEAPAPSLSSAPTAPPRRDRPPAAVARRNATGAPAFAASLGLITDAGALPHASIGGTAGVSMWLASFGLRAEAAVFAPASEQLGPGQSAQFNLVAGALLACFQRPLGSLAAVGCAGDELGQLSGEGRGVSQPHARSVLWHAPRVEIGVRIPLGAGFRALAFAGAALPIKRNDFELEGAPVHRSGAVSLRGQLGLELAL